ncbi:MAG: hypothetical protein ACSHXY_04665 [Alphaproteobacteria bacterium]
MSLLEEAKTELPILTWDIFTKGDASNLAANRRVLSKFDEVTHKGHLMRTAYKLVIDANFIWNEVSYHLSVGEKPSTLTELSRSGLCEFHAPTWLLEELESSVLPKLAKHHCISSRVLRAIFDEFIRPQIQFHLGYRPPKEIAYGDNKDVPYVELAEDMGALGVISEDTDIERLLMRKIDRKEVLKFIELARIENGVVQVKCLGYIGVNVSAGSVSELCKATSNLVKKAPKELLAAAAIVGVLGLAWFSSTERGRKQAKSVGKIALPPLMAGVEFVGKGIKWANENDRKAIEIRNVLEKV